MRIIYSPMYCHFPALSASVPAAGSRWNVLVSCISSAGLSNPFLCIFATNETFTRGDKYKVKINKNFVELKILIRC